ncbi:hypothetical protein RIF23_15825 [Lipingzhangella sp. LS1_29]|uniref:T2SS protein K second SAM-like domain-containing protein n=1 Tax=Lipingzhangella rawalii TaxID=2055835 RepID=A0ABU2HA73_9ACTN|nr:type II secretion system protein GspK [Lipingzhangella rawalii]MDS1271764.1 hypothetical protein [Lipingzhangella rawalii]
MRHSSDGDATSGAGEGILVNILARPHTALTWLWALAPTLTCGWGAPVTFGIAAYLHRSRGLLYTCLGYLGLLFLVYFAVSPLAQSTSGTEAISLFVWMLLLLVPTVHAVAIRSRVFAAQLAHEQRTARTNQDTLLHAQQRRGLRSQARVMVANDPMMAQELRIGRPDVPDRTYDDGGVIDLNHVPEELLRSRLAMLSSGDVTAIVQERQASGPFRSLQDLQNRVPISPGALPELREFAVFLP